MPTDQCTSLVDFSDPREPANFASPIASPKLLFLAVAAALASATLRAEGLLEETVLADMDWQPMKDNPARLSKTLPADNAADDMSTRLPAPI